MREEKVNIVDTQGKDYKHVDSYSAEEAKYLYKEMVVCELRAKGLIKTVGT